MQLKLLNTHKFLANLSYEMIGSFVPLIVYQLTGNLFYGILFLFVRYGLSIIIDTILRKVMENKPQIFLILRIIPICLISLFVMLLENYFWVGFFGSAIFTAFAYSFGTLPNYFTYNYSSVKTNGSAAGISLMIEKGGVIMAVIAGGLFLDYLDTVFVILISFIIYIISCIPLIIYYINARKNSNLNKETTSNAMIKYKENEVRNKAGKLVSKKMLYSYAFTYFICCTTDVFLNVFNLNMYIKTGQFQLNGYFSAMLNIAIAVGGIISAKFEDKHDLTVFTSAIMALSGVVLIAMPFISNIPLLFVLMFVVGFSMATYSSYLLNRVLAKTRILGISNRAMFVRNEGSSLGYFMVFIACCFGTVVPGFFVCGVCNLLSGIVIPINEERTRKMLVEYLENGSIKQQSNLFEKLKRSFSRKNKKLIAESANVLNPAKEQEKNKK